MSRLEELVRLIWRCGKHTLRATVFAVAIRTFVWCTLCLRFLGTITSSYDVHFSSKRTFPFPLPVTLLS
jgi:hypothetical protein